MQSKIFLKFTIILSISLAALFLYLKSPALNEPNTPPIDFKSFDTEADNLLKNMTTDEKIGQMMLVSLTPSMRNGSFQETDKNLGAVLVAGNDEPIGGPALANWKKMMNSVKQAATLTLKDGTKIEPLLGTDAVHGDQHVLGAVIFPHNIGLGATHNLELVKKIAAFTAYDAKQSGFNWVFAPTIAVAHDYRWGRTYESFSSDPTWVQYFAEAYVNGAQQNNAGKISGALTSAKHYIGDGYTFMGQDEGNISIPDQAGWDKLFSQNFSGYQGAFSQSVGSVMISYSSINNKPMTLQQDLITNTLFVKNGFEGLIVTDYGAVEKAANKMKLSYPEALIQAINSGIHLVMLNNNFSFEEEVGQFRKTLTAAVSQNKISQTTLDAAVRRILRVKLAMGLVSSTSPVVPAPVPNEDEKSIALQAAEQSLVLLKNENAVIPVNSQNLSHVILLGSRGFNYKTQTPGPYAFDDIGSQSGGWTVVWQGSQGNDYWRNSAIDNKASSILDGVRKLAPQVPISENSVPSGASAQNSLAIVVLAEPPYAEFMGDVANNNPLYANEPSYVNPYVPLKQKNTLQIGFDQTTLETINQLKNLGVPVITVLLSGRPMIISDFPDNPWDKSNAFIAAWLPGTTGGEAIANAIFGQYHFRKDYPQANTLSFAWPRYMSQVGEVACVNHGKSGRSDLLADCGDGLTT